MRLNHRSQCLFRRRERTFDIAFYPPKGGNATFAHRKATLFLRGPLVLAVLVATVVGCSKPVQKEQAKAPLPVTVMTLAKIKPQSSYSASGTVKAWKTEQIGFEVSGRVEWVLEPGKNIDGRVYDPDGKLIMAGTQLAQIESDRYDIAVESAKADVDVATLSREGIEIRKSNALPAQLASAKADLELANAEFARVKKLADRNAASASEFEQARTLVQTRDASVRSLEASLLQADAELKSADAQILRAQQALKDAERDQQNTKLFGSYQGQISDVSVVPGSVVTAGSPVLTLQMTNPIKVDVELSAQQSRRIRQRRSLPASYELFDGSKRDTTAFVYNVDASADPTTRTFTMTLLLLNELVRNDPPQVIGNPTIARSEDLWPIRLNRMMGTDDGVILVEETSIRHDDAGAYIYVATNAKLREIVPPVVRVRRQRLIEHDLRIPFLGNWIFRSISFVDDEGAAQQVSPDSMYVGLLKDDADQLEQWDGESVVLDSGDQWMLRPGDLVYVDLSENDVAPGFFVPIEAVYKNSQTASLFVVNNGTVKQLPITIASGEDLDTGSMIRVDSPGLVDGMQIVVGGVHFLRDGQTVRVIGDSMMPVLSDNAPIADPIAGPIETKPAEANDAN